MEGRFNPENSLYFTLIYRKFKLRFKKVCKGNESMPGTPGVQPPGQRFTNRPACFLERLPIRMMVCTPNGPAARFSGLFLGTGRGTPGTPGCVTPFYHMVSWRQLAHLSYSRQNF